MPLKPFAQRLCVAAACLWFYAARVEAQTLPFAPPSAPPSEPAAAAPAPATPSVPVPAAEPAPAAAAATEPGTPAAPAPASERPQEPAGAATVGSLGPAPASPSAPPPKAAPTTAPKVAPAAATSTGGVPVPAPDTRSWIGAGMALGVLDLPKLAAGVQLRGQLRLPRAWPIDLGVAYYFDNTAELSQDELDLKANEYFVVPFPSTGSRLVLNAWRANAALCPYERGLDTGTLQLCTGLFGELLRVKSEGLLSPSAKNRGLFAFEAYARWHFPLGKSIGVSYSAGLFVPFNRDRYGYLDRFGDFSSKFRVAVIGGRLDLALTYALE